MSIHRPTDGSTHDPATGVRQPIVHPAPDPPTAHGPTSIDDLIVHTGEARGLADTARSSLPPDAPTAQAATRRPV